VALAGTALLAVLLNSSRSTGNLSPPVQQPQTPPASTLQGAIDIPSEGSGVSGPVYVVGWAIDAASAQGSGVDRVSVYLDDTFIADAHYGLPRNDIAAAYGDRFRNSGWQALLDLDTLATSGEHRLEVRAHSATSGATAAFPRALSVSSPQRFGINAHPLWFDITHAVSDFDEIRANGLDTVRLDVAWDLLQPTAPDAWDTQYLARLDDVLDLIAARGLHPIVVVHRTPAWARDSIGSAATPPTDPATYAATVGFLARRYAQRTGMVYEIWNEPNQHQFWDSPDGSDPTAYIRLLRAAYTSIKSVAPSATVLGGSVAFNDSAYIKGMYAAGAAGAFDALSLHPYSGTNPPDATEDPWRSFVLAIDQTHEIMQANHDADKTIWITEMGWSTADVPDAVRAGYLEGAVNLVRARRFVAAMCVYQLDQSDDVNTGLVAPDGSYTRSWLSYGQAARSR
jgi:hypothetical protein